MTEHYKSHDNINWNRHNLLAQNTNAIYIKC